MSEAPGTNETDDCTLVISRALYGAQKVAADRLLRDQLSCGLKQAMTHVDNAVTQGNVRIEGLSFDTAQTLASRLNELKFEARVENSAI